MHTKLTAVENLKWDERFLSQAQLVSSWSKDSSTKVGAVVVDRDRRVVSQGYNGYAQGVDDSILNREQKIRRTIHAESNALAFAQRSLKGCTIYVTHPTCSQCAASIIQHGISTVVFKAGSQDFLTRWKDDQDEALAMYREAGVEVIIY